MYTFWSHSPADVAKTYDTDIAKGLLVTEADIRLREQGKNIISAQKRRSAFTIFLLQFTSPLIMVLLVTVVVTLIMSQFKDALFILVAVIVNATLGFYQEFKADRAIASLAKYLRQTSRVVRGGKELLIDTEDIVVGDIVHLMQGERVPADGKLTMTNDFQVDESLVTGESLAVTKSVGIDPEDAVLGDRQTSVLAGTLIIQGTASMIVCATGSKTEFGKIAQLIDTQQEGETPLQQKIKAFSIRLSIILIGLVILIFVIGISAGYPLKDMLITALALAVSAIPESLPIAMTVILAIGVERMAKRKGVIKRLVAAETLGSATVIVTDKTGTLTKAQMELVDILTLGEGIHLNNTETDAEVLESQFKTISEESQFLTRALVNAYVTIQNPEESPETWLTDGKIMEVALVKGLALHGHKLGYLQDKQHVIQSLPFNPIHKFSVSLVETEQGYELVFFGAPDILLQYTNLSDQAKQKIKTAIHEQAVSGKRLLGVAHKSVAAISDISQLHHVYETDITFDGLIAFKDPLREGVADVIHTLEYAGIKTLIMTGDHEGTAISIAQDIGIFRPNCVLDVSVLRTLSEEELKRRLPDVRVISRVTPQDKHMIVKALQSLGEIVAMAGDGINDAPSIKAADVGIAMGSGTEVSRNVADVVLLDDNFETIVSAVEEGRQIMKNIRKTLVYLLSNITNGMVLIGGSVVFGFPLPVNALQMLWVNFFSDSFPALAFAFEKEKNVFLEHTVDTTKGLFTKRMKFLVGLIGILISTLLFTLYIFLLKQGYDQAIVKTFIFGAFGTYTLFVALSLRSLEMDIFRYSIFSNKMMVIGVIVGIVLMMSGIYIPFLQGVLGTVALPPIWLLGVFGVGLLNTAIVELAKLIYRKMGQVR